MLDTVKRTIFDYMMLETGENVLVALSGGADSAALLLSLRELGYPVRAFHLNHCLRGAESDRDEAFCRRLCEKLGVELTVERVDIAAAAGDSAVEETARRIRYARLEHAAHGAKIAVAHNADDNLETMLFHLVRGTGAKGLMGIPPVRLPAEAESSTRRSRLHKVVHRSVHNSAGKSRPAEADAKAVLPPAPPADSIPAERERPLDGGGCAYKPCPRSCCP